MQSDRYELLAESEPVSESKSEVFSSSAKSQKCINAARIILGLIGAGAGFLYWTPSGVCVKSPTCGQFLADSISSPEIARYVMFLSGAIGFSGTNMYYSSQFYENFLQFLSEQKSLSAKVGKGTFVVVYGIGQASHILLAVLGTGGELLSASSLLTIGGALPGGLFGAVGVAKNTLPKVYEKLNWVLTEHVYYSLFNPKNDLEEAVRNRIKFYMQEQKHFLKQVEANLKQLILQAKTIDVPVGMQDALGFLFQQNTTPVEESSLEKGLRYVARLAGTGITCNFLYPLVTNTFELSKQFVPYTGLQLGLTALLSTSSIYNNFKITCEGVDAIYKTLKNLLTGQKVDSMTFQLRPKSLALIVSMCSSISILSFAVINVMWDKYYQGPAKDELRQGARVGIDVNHAYALILFSMSVLRNLTKEPKAKFLFKLEDEVNRLKGQSPKAFAEFVESLDENQKRLYGVRAFNGEKPAPSRSWCSWFSWGTKKEEPVEEMQLAFHHVVTNV